MESVLTIWKDCAGSKRMRDTDLGHLPIDIERTYWSVTPNHCMQQPDWYAEREYQQRCGQPTDTEPGFSPYEEIVMNFISYRIRVVLVGRQEDCRAISTRFLTQASEQDRGTRGWRYGLDRGFMKEAYR